MAILSKQTDERRNALQKDEHYIAMVNHGERMSELLDEWRDLNTKKDSRPEALRRHVIVEEIRCTKLKYQAMLACIHITFGRNGTHDDPE